MEPADVNTVEDSPGLGPGGRLQAARIQLGLSIGDVASRMHLSTAILEALEENNFDEITAPIFVKGYLRAYARIVSIDEDAIIREYGELYSNEDPPITTTSNTASEISSSDTRVKWMTYLVILVLIALLGAWWWSQQQTSEQLISLDAEEPTLPTVVVEEAPAPVEPTPETLDVVVEDEPEPEVVEEELPLLSLQPQPEESISVETVEIEESIDTTVTEESVTESPAQLAAVEVQPVSNSIPVNTQVRQAPDGSDQFTLVVNADTWADIKDATGFQLIYDLARADNTIEMTGTAPFVVFLGNGHGVDVEINGEPLDISTFIRGDNTARFQTGG